jgi:hypothetical protein
MITSSTLRSLKAGGIWMLISKLAQKTGLHPETIRRLEKRGLISSRRDINNWRRYGPDALDKLKKLYATSDDPKRPEDAA